MLSRAPTPPPALPYSYLPLPFLLSSAMLTYTLLHDVDCMVRCCAVVCLWCVWCVACATGRIARRGSYPCYWAEPFRPHGQPSTSLGKSSLLSAPFFPTLPLPLLPPSPYILLPLHPSVSLLSLLFFKRSICSIFHLIRSLPFFFSLLLLDIALHFVPSARRLTTQ